MAFLFFDNIKVASSKELVVHNKDTGGYKSIKLMNCLKTDLKKKYVINNLEASLFSCS